VRLKACALPLLTHRNQGPASRRRDLCSRSSPTGSSTTWLTRRPATSKRPRPKLLPLAKERDGWPSGSHPRRPVLAPAMAGPTFAGVAPHGRRR